MLPCLADPGKDHSEDIPAEFYEAPSRKISNSDTKTSPRGFLTSTGPEEKLVILYIGLFLLFTACWFYSFLKRYIFNRHNHIIRLHLEDRVFRETQPSRPLHIADIYPNQRRHRPMGKPHSWKKKRNREEEGEKRVKTQNEWCCALTHKVLSLKLHIT